MMYDKKIEDRYVRIKYANAMRIIKNARARSHSSSKTEVFVSNSIILDFLCDSRMACGVLVVGDNSSCR